MPLPGVQGGMSPNLYIVGLERRQHEAVRQQSSRAPE